VETIKGKEKFSNANLNKESKDYEEAIRLYKELLEENEYDRLEVLLQLGGSYYFSKKYSEAYLCYKQTIEIDSREEIASLGFYLACTELDKLKDGVLEMKRFLSESPPILYQDTIRELLKELQNGYATDFKEDILELAKKHNISLSNG